MHQANTKCAVKLILPLHQLTGGKLWVMCPTGHL